MHLALPSISPVSDVLSQAMNVFAGRASTAASNFESDLQSGNISGAQSFLSALQQKLSPGSAGGSADSLAPAFAQVHADLNAGNLAGAQTDFASLKVALSELNHRSGSSTSTSASATKSETGTEGTMGATGLANLNPGYLLQQSAYNSALNLSVPANVPGFSANW